MLCVVWWPTVLLKTTARTNPWGGLVVASPYTFPCGQQPIRTQLYYKRNTTMTRKDFIAIADVLGLISNPEERRIIIDKMCEHLAESNGRFNRSRFLQHVEKVARTKEHLDGIKTMVRRQEEREALATVSDLEFSMRNGGE